MIADLEMGILGSELIVPTSHLVEVMGILGSELIVPTSHLVEVSLEARRFILDLHHRGLEGLEPVHVVHEVPILVFERPHHHQSLGVGHGRVHFTSFQGLVPKFELVDPLLQPPGLTLEGLECCVRRCAPVAVEGIRGVGLVPLASRLSRLLGDR